MVLPPVFHRVEEATRIIFAVETLRANASELLHAPDRVSRQLTEIAARGATVPAESLREARQTVREAGAALAVAMAAAEVPVLLTPATADEAPDSLDWTGDAVFNRVWTAIGVPAITVPQRYGPRGLPVGLQIVAGRGHDATLLAAAGRMEHVLRRGADAVRLVV
jgi:Asp-tRNA(Asn)/Glu-tRNA(Gln) amidotransferase A subunit family amidase